MATRLPVSSPQLSFRAAMAEELEDPVSGDLMTRAVTILDCGHTFNEDTVKRCLAHNKLCPLDRRPIVKYIPNFTVRNLAGKAHSQNEEEKGPSEEAQALYLQGKAFSEQGNQTAAIESLLKALELSPTYEKAQAYLDFCLERATLPVPPVVSSETYDLQPSAHPLDPEELHKWYPKEEKGSSSTSQSLFFSSGDPQDRYINLLLKLLEHPQVQNNASLKNILERQLEELMSSDDKELKPKDQESFKWTQKLLVDEKVNKFVANKLIELFLPISPPSVAASSVSSLQPISSVTPVAVTPVTTSRRILKKLKTEPVKTACEQALPTPKIKNEGINCGATIHSLIPLPGGLLLTHVFLGKIMVCDLSTQQIIQTINGKFHSVALLDNGHIAIGSDDHNIQIRDLRKGLCLRILKGHEYSVGVLLALPGGRLVSGDIGGVIKLWDLSNGECLQTFYKHELVRKFVLFPNNVLASTGMDNTIKLWDLSVGWFTKVLNGGCFKTFKIESDVLTVDIARVGDNLLAIAPGNNSIQIWNISTEKCVRTIRHVHPIKYIASLGSGLLASACKNIMIWDPLTGKPIQTLKGQDEICCLTQLDGGFFATGNNAGIVRWVKPEKINVEAILITVKFKEQVFNVEITPTFDGKEIKPTDKMREIERQKKIYTKMIQEIVQKHEADYTEDLGQIKELTGKGFIFEGGILPHGNKTTDLWNKFLEKLGNPEL